MTTTIHLLRILTAVLGLILLLCAAGRLYQVISWQADARRSPEPGRRFDAGGVRLQLYCTGAGSSTVVLESGLGDTLDEWRRVQPAISAFARVCSYDRAGYGNSEAGQLPQTSDRIAVQLHALLDRAGERPPYILVGHSAGGYHVRVFHGRYPSEVAAMVLVDSTQEDQYRLLPPAWRNLGAAMVNHYRTQSRWAPFEVGLGIKRLMLSLERQQPPYLLLQAKYFRARASELESIRISAEQARRAGNLGEKPLIVLTGGKNSDLRPGEWLTARDIEEYQHVWVHDLQPRLAALSSHSQWMVLPDSGHDVPADRPDAIIDAVRELSPAK